MLAGNTMARITKSCINQTGSQNVYKYKGIRYMWEINPVEHRDGSITGTIYRFDAGQRVGAFKISGKGTIVSGYGLSSLIGEPGVPKKMERLDIQRYKYNGFHSSTGRRGDIIYVDLQNKHPDPLKKLIWGYHKNGDLASGDYSGFFEKVGSPVSFEFAQTGRTAAEEKSLRHKAIIAALKSGKV
jgi:hypothetical protein